MDGFLLQLGLDIFGQMLVLHSPARLLVKLVQNIWTRTGIAEIRVITASLKQVPLSLRLVPLSYFWANRDHAVNCTTIRR